MMGTLEDASLDRQRRFDYRSHRYLEHETPDQLQQRFEDLLRNAYFCWRDGKLYSKGDGTKWMCWMAHLLEEFSLRGMRGPLRLPKFTSYRNASRAAELWDGLNLEKGTYLLKFGETQYMRPLWEKGAFTIFPATKYNEAVLNEAIRDDELTLMQQSCGATINSVQDWRTGIRHDFDRPIPIIGPLKRETRYESNCYVACFGRRYEYRLFDDFGYDACVVIREPQRFIERIRECMALALPGWDFCGAAVSYRDPCHPTPTDDVLFSKHFRFTYQQEFRIVWEGPTRQTTLGPVPLDLGSVTDYCDLVIL
jgi:hypothetical protein